jgi:hypothetical protein
MKDSFTITRATPLLEIVTTTYYVVNLPVSSIANFVTHESRLIQPNFYELENDILVNGMKHPIIVTENTLEAYNHGKQSVDENCLSLYDSKKPYLCLFGNQRLAVAFRNNYENIDSIVVSTPEEAIIVHNQLCTQ